MCHSTDLRSTYALATLCVIVSLASSTPVSNDKDTQTSDTKWRPPLATKSVHSSAHKVDPTLNSFLEELKALIGDSKDESKPTHTTASIETTTTTEVSPTTQKDTDPLMEELNRFMQQPDVGFIITFEKSQDNSLKNVVESDSALEDLASTNVYQSTAPHRTVPPTEVDGVLTKDTALSDSKSENLDLMNFLEKIGLHGTTSGSGLEGVSTTKSSPEVASLISKLTTNELQSSGSNDDVVEVAVVSQKERRSELIDTKIILIIGATAAGLLLVLLIVVLVYLSRPKSPKSRGMYLNSDLNRWDPQLLRPNQKSIDSFIFGSPIPSISEMIKAQDDVENPAVEKST